MQKVRIRQLGLCLLIFSFDFKASIFCSDRLPIFLDRITGCVQEVLVFELQTQVDKPNRALGIGTDHNCMKPSILPICNGNTYTQVAFDIVNEKKTLYLPRQWLPYELPERWNNQRSHPHHIFRSMLFSFCQPTPFCPFRFLKKIQIATKIKL